MKILHTSDWHLGNSLFNIDRSKETDCFFSWLKKTIVDNEVTALLVSGDIFDTVNPPVLARNKYFTFLASLLDTCCKNIIITGGNHDSAVLLDAPKELLSALNIKVTGSIADRSIEDMVFPLKDKDGKTMGICAAIPFAREIELRPYRSDESKSFFEDTYTNLYKKAGELCIKLKGKDNLPLIAMGHLYASDLEGRYSEQINNEHPQDGTRSLDITGNLGSISDSVFGNYFDYVALGHIHYTTMVNKNPGVRYCGSPFVLGFDEANIAHNVLLIDCDNKDDLKVSKITVPQFIKFKRVTGSIDFVLHELDALNGKNGDTPLYVEVCYESEAGRNIHEELALKSNDFDFEIVSFKHIKKADLYSRGEHLFDLTEIKSIDEDEIFKSLILSQTGFDKDSVEAKALLDDYLPLIKSISQEID